MRTKHFLLAGLSAFSFGVVFADEPLTTPRPIPLTRPEMKVLIEEMKARKPRIPLPELTAEDKEKLGERGNGYEGRLRYHYMPAGEMNAFGFGGGAGGRGTGNRGAGGGGAGRGAGGGQGANNGEYSLDNTFKVQLFWIVCRTNNCQYCQGHQESKLLRAGQKEDQIAALDGDWSVFTEAERAAFAYARKITFEPHLIGDADIDGLRKYYKDAQILEMTMSIAGNNAINRWKEGCGVPQSEGGGGFGGNRDGEPAEKHTYLTPTSDQYKKLVTKVAPLSIDEKTGLPTTNVICKRPALESRADVESALEAAKKRAPRLPLVAEDATRKLLPVEMNVSTIPQWMRLLATFPTAGKSRIVQQLNVEEKGELSKLLRAQVSWVIARQDRAWYATGLAKKKLTELGQTDDQIYSLDGDLKNLPAKDRALLTVARKLAASPVVLTDADVDEAVKLAGPRDVVQLINYTTTRASFDRITEAAGLQIDK